MKEARSRVLGSFNLVNPLRPADRMGMASVHRTAFLTIFLTMGILLLFFSRLSAQVRPLRPRTTSSQQNLENRIKELEKKVEGLEEGGGMSKKELEKEIEKEVEKNYSKGIVTLGGLSFRIGGQMKVNIVDVENEVDPVFGNTESPDPHLEFQRFRISPQINFPKSDVLGDFTLRSQIDFHPTEGDTILREAALEHELSPEWWFSSQIKIGLDDRFIRGARTTQAYPLVGLAYWRNESVAVQLELSFGDKRGRPVKKSEKKPAPRRPRTPKAREEAEEFQETSAPSEDSDPSYESDLAAEEFIPARSSQTRSTVRRPFDFIGNPGELKLHFSIGNGYEFEDRKVGRDNAPFNQILVDSRNFEPPLSMREIGVGVGYERDFRELGEVEVLGFYYNDELTDDSVDFLQTNLTEFEIDGITPRRGYGISDERKKDRLGVNIGYHFESYHLFKVLGIEDVMNAKRGDGLYLFYQWISSTDGDLDREGWYAQGSFRISNPARWRFLRTIEPVVRYGELNPDIERIPGLPLTWYRSQWLLGAVFGIAPGIFIRTEYTFNRESTGAGSLRNNEFLVQFLAIF